MKYIRFFLITCMTITFLGCEKFLDKPPLTVVNDETAWTSEVNVRLYANKFYTSFFPGYGLNFDYSGAPLMDYQFSDDVFLMGNQGNFGRSVPNTGGWSYSLVRSLNIMIDRIQTRMVDILEPEAYNHWLGIGRFFRGMEYASIVRRYGDIPYYDHVVSDIDEDDLYKPRTPRNDVTDAIYDDFKFALQNVRASDGDMYLNKYSIAAFISREALYEGSWQKYYYNNSSRAQKFFELAEEAAGMVMTSGRYDIVTDFRTLFTSNNLAGNRDVVLFRHYDASVGILHAIASNNNLTESVAFGPSTDLIKSFICVDGEAWQNSGAADANDFTLSKMIQSRDSRLEATFYDKPFNRNRASYWYINKFFPRSAVASFEAGTGIPVELTSSKNETDYPVFRYSEALLNWIEAKAELGTVGQGDIDASINKIRNRPLAPEAIARGVTKTAALSLSNLPNDPERDPSVSALLWEIRRERRMEFAFEYGRYEDLRRWKKLEYMDTDDNHDLLSGGWVNFPEEIPGEMVAGKKDQISVVKQDGTISVFNGSNSALMRGFYRDPKTNGRLSFLNIPNVNPYLSPMSKFEMDRYRAKGYELKQTEGWPAY